VFNAGESGTIPSIRGFSEEAAAAGPCFCRSATPVGCLGRQFRDIFLDLYQIWYKSKTKVAETREAPSDVE
jgi:hypothetical protein